MSWSDLAHKLVATYVPFFLFFMDTPMWLYVLDLRHLWYHGMS